MWLRSSPGHQHVTGLCDGEQFVRNSLGQIILNYIKLFSLHIRSLNLLDGWMNSHRGQGCRLPDQDTFLDC